MKRLAGLLLFVLTLAFLSLLIGGDGISWPVWHEPLGRALFWLRLHRVATGFVTGAGLALAGVILQAVLRNPLADPYILGVSGGGALGAAVVILLGWHLWHPALLPGGAALAAAATLLLVYLLASQGGGPSVYSLILSGVIVSSMASSLLLLLLSLARAEGLRSVTWWTLGNLQGGSPELLGACATAILVALIMALLLARGLDLLTLGSATAHHLGIRPQRVMVLALAAATLAAAAAVALAGLIGFVGLIVPHIVRQWLGARHRPLLLAAALTGGGLLILCDILARTLLAPRELPVGVITSLIGGPFFLWLLRRRRQVWSAG